MYSEVGYFRPEGSYTMNVPCNYAVKLVFVLYACFDSRIAQPILVRLFIKSFGDSEVGPYDQYLYAAGVCLTKLLHTLIIHHVTFQLFCMSMKFRIAITAFIYRKVVAIISCATLTISVQSEMLYT